MLAPVSSIQLLHELVGFSYVMNNHPNLFVRMNGKSKLSSHFPPMIGCFACSPFWIFKAFDQVQPCPPFMAECLGPNQLDF
jgi:hypothetical protein